MFAYTDTGYMRTEIFLDRFRYALRPRPPGYPGSGKPCIAHQSAPYRVCETEPDRHRGPSQPQNASTSAAGRPC